MKTLKCIDCGREGLSPQAKRCPNERCKSEHPFGMICTICGQISSSSRGTFLGREYKWVHHTCYSQLKREVKREQAASTYRCRHCGERVLHTVTTDPEGISHPVFPEACPKCGHPVFAPLNTCKRCGLSLIEGNGVCNSYTVSSGGRYPSMHTVIEHLHVYCSAQKAEQEAAAINRYETQQASKTEQVTPASKVEGSGCLFVLAGFMANLLLLITLVISLFWLIFFSPYG